MCKFVISLVLLLSIVSISSVQAQDEPVLRIGYLPIMVMEQHFVAEDQGWYDELGIEYETIRFQGGPAIVQAFAAGELDVAWVGINPSLVMAARGIPVSVVAANVYDGLDVIANDTFAEIWAENPTAEAFSIYEEQEGRKLRVATLSQGSTPDTVLRLWLDQLGLTTDDIELSGLGIDQVQAALAANRVDASLIMEPVITLSQEQDWGFQVIVPGGEILPLQPGATLTVSQDLIDNNPDLVSQLVDIHIRGTLFANDDLDEAARIASEGIGAEILPVEIARIAVESPTLNWISDPNIIIDSTQTYNAFQVEIGVFDEAVAMEDLFDTSFFDALIETNPEYAEQLPNPLTASEDAEETE
ncbi:MAG: ABC transporter substrate-binding protein [Chloroflexota bacterium]